MSIMKPARAILLLTLFILMFSCKDGGPSEISCGCNGPTDRYIVGGWSRYLGGGKFAIRLAPTSQSEMIAVACSIDNKWIVSTDSTKADYVITANTKLSCQPGYSSYRGPTEMKITKITKIP